MGKAARFCKKFLGLLEQQANPIRYARKIGVRIGEGCSDLRTYELGQ